MQDRFKSAACRCVNNSKGGQQPMSLFNREFINSFCVIAPAVVLAMSINMWLVPDYGFIIATIAQVGNITYWSLVSSWAASKNT